MALEPSATVMEVANSIGCPFAEKGVHPSTSVCSDLHDAAFLPSCPYRLLTSHLYRSPLDNPDAFRRV
jgi:hypothetical protein